MKKQLPSRPNLEQLKKQAKSLLKGHQAGSADALAQIREHHPRWKDMSDKDVQQATFLLSDAQLVIAHGYGFATWAALKAHVRLHEAPPSTESVVNALREAARRGDVSLLGSMLDADPTLIDEQGGPGVRTALHEAVGGEQVEAVRLLLERGADPNVRCEGDNAYPLHFAAEKQHFPIIRMLIEHGADPTGEGDYHELGVIGWATAWEYVTANVEIVAYLMAHGARHNIWSAVAMGAVESIREFAARSPGDLEKRMDMANRRRRPLHLAVMKKQREALTVLLELGANMESLDEAGFTALDQAALLGEREMAQMLMDGGARVRLPAAIALERRRDVERLLRKDPESVRPGNRWGLLILRASERSPGAVIEALIEAGAAVNVRDDPKTSVDSTSGYTPLHAAAFHGNRSAAEALLKHGADVRAREDKYHGTPAGWANYAGRAEVRDLILRAAVDLMEAVEYGLTERVRAVVKDDPDALERRFEEYPVYPRYAYGWYSPLAFAVGMGQAEMVRLLLEMGADHGVCGPEGETLVEMARKGGHEGIAEMVGQREA